jgi:beta-glucosidase/6-phospho-beta-glucosidase/beta-galactosidase
MHGTYLPQATARESDRCIGVPYARPYPRLLAVGCTSITSLKLVEKYGAFADRRAIDAFERFGDRVKHWITVNEQNVMVRIPEMLGYTADDPGCAAKCAQANYHLCHDMLARRRKYCL